MGNDDVQLDTLRSEIIALRKLVEQLGAQINEQAEVILALQQENEKLKRENEQLVRRLLGPKSEKMPSISREVRKKKGQKKKDGKAARKKNAEAKKELPSDEQFHRVPDADRHCPNCPGVELTALGSPESSVEYEYVPARFIRRVHLREKLSCPKCGGYIVIARPPVKVYDKAQYGPGFIAHLVVSKCADAIPLYRQAKQLKRAGVPVARSTMTELFHRAAELLLPLVRRQLQLIAQSKHVLADETSLPIQAENKTRRGFVWTFIGAGLISYLYSPDRSGETPNKLLGGTPGKLLVDGYTGYNQVCEVEGRERAGCLAHCRRHFFDAKSNAPDEVRHALDVIVEIYAVEDDAKEARILGTEAHRALRQEITKPLMDDFKKWLEEQQPLHPPKSPLVAAINYALNQWKPLTCFLDDPGLPPDNNESERRLRLIALGRKNYLFAGHDEGAENLATLMSLVVTCEAHDINPETYLADVLLRVQDHPASLIDQLLPPMWKAARVVEAAELADATLSTRG
jgi:transposase